VGGAQGSPGGKTAADALPTFFDSGAAAGVGRFGSSRGSVGIGALSGVSVAGKAVGLGSATGPLGVPKIGGVEAFVVFAGSKDWGRTRPAYHPHYWNACSRRTHFIAREHIP